MPKFVIEREIPNAAKLSPEELRGISQKSCGVLRNLGPQIQWVQRVMSPTTNFTASTSRRTRRWCKNMQSKAAFRLIEYQRSSR
jgi:hypothetical protein